MTDLENLRLIGVAVRNLINGPNVCPTCGGWKSERSWACFGCREIARDEQERREALR